MGKITIFLISLSTIVLLLGFGRGLTTLRAGDTGAHLFWDMAILFTVLAVNFVAAIHAAQSDRLIRALRSELSAAAGESTEAARV
jgi:hypothetical protein